MTQAPTSGPGGASVATASATGGASSYFAPALVSPSPHPSIAAGAELYSWLIGSWEATVVDYPEDGPPRRQRGEWHFAWILEGRAMQDVWIVPPRGERLPNPATLAGNRYGSSLRTYDADQGVWKVIWRNPVTGAESHLVGRRQGADVVQIGRDDDGRQMRWTFTDIGADRFRWLGESSSDEGRNWRLEAEFRARRVRPQPPMPWEVRWQWVDRPGLELLRLTRDGGSVLAQGHVVVEIDRVSTKVTYLLRYDSSWRFHSSTIQTKGGEAARALEIVRTEGDSWSINGSVHPALDGCTDLDLMVTPFTNTPPLLRFGLAPGEARGLRVAWVRLPELAVEPVEQEYRRPDADAAPHHYMYKNLSTGFEGELELDGRGLVISYGPWRRLP